MTTRAKLTVFAALASTLVMCSLLPLLRPNGWAAHSVLLITATAAIGAGLRRLPTPRILIVPLQLLGVVYLVMLGFVQSSMAAGLLPGPRALDALGGLLASGGSDIQEYSIPAPATAGLRLIVVGSVALIAVLVDALAVTYRRAAAAGLPLLALYSVGTGLAGDGTAAWLWFLLAGGGYLALLHIEGQDRISRWGRVFHGTGRSGAATVAHGGRQAGVVALAVALVLPVFVPHMGAGLIGGFGNGGAGAGLGPGGGGLKSLSPVVALTSALRNTDNTILLDYTSDGAHSDEMYLRVAALDEFDGVEWTFGDQEPTALPPVLPQPDGLSAGASPSAVHTTVKATENLSSEWLPLPYPATTVEVKGRWRFDPITRMVTGDNGQKTNGLSYQVTSLDVQPTAEQLRTAGPAPKEISSKYLALPDNLPQEVKATALQVTAGKTNAYDRALALQTWFTSPLFKYNTKIDAGTGTDAIKKFLADKEGFCVHFAATMAAMARSLNIPARVAIGFTPGQALGGNNRQVRSLDYHAWPELYFPGSGWTRFEPTPSRGSAPVYTRDTSAPATTAPTTQPTADPTGASSAPSPSGGESCDPKLRRIGECGGGPKDAALGAGQDAWWTSTPVLASGALIVLLLALLVTPMLWRTRIRRRRLGVGRHRGGPDRVQLTDDQVLAAWQELIDSAWDLGIPPDDARTPRSAVQRLAESAELDAESAAAAGRVALATEQVMYARSGAATAPLGPDVRAAREGMLARTGRLGRIRAVLLPASLARVWWRAADRVMVLRQAARERTARVFAAVRSAVTKPFRRG
ncbi:transglutaminaseTgpA domain-containing protein [Kitasatospora sp. NPDC088346]|uniref:transglutaminase family protein n=1 Tax=Kitasatospora sp. NPDC088346 TaxID=3364073 RepID=UPI003816EC5C